jgi:hypothetical protein
MVMLISITVRGKSNMPSHTACNPDIVIAAVLFIDGRTASISLSRPCSIKLCLHRVLVKMEARVDGEFGSSYSNRWSGGSVVQMSKQTFELLET